MSEPILRQTDERGVATISFNRPDKHNAFDTTLIEKLLDTLRDCNADSAVRAVVLTGAGESFSSGADLHWMRLMGESSEAQNIEDALQLAELLSFLNRLSKPTIAAVNGPAYGGAVGLVACCDVAVAVETARFALSEVRLGLVPAVISPYVIAAIGARTARRYFLTGEALDTETACRIGLVHVVTTPQDFTASIQKHLDLLLKGGPQALRECKELIALVAGSGESVDQTLQRRTAEIISQVRLSPEAEEGISAFLEKRPAAWVH